jgi:hypothetical protein
MKSYTENNHELLARKRKKKIRERKKKETIQTGKSPILTSSKRSWGKGRYFVVSIRRDQAQVHTSGEERDHPNATYRQWAGELETDCARIAFHHGFIPVLI